MLVGWLEYHRATLLWKCADLTEEQLKERSVGPSSMSLLGLLRHMTEVERSWFGRTFAGRDRPPLYYSDADPDGDFDSLDSVSVSDARAAFDRAVEESRAVADGKAPDAISVADHHGEGRPSLRWIYTHMIEEYARHNGHADFLRERIDGSTGD
ncbi:DinB family protein [Actinomycetes bacterium M1A6_2h]